MAGVTTSNSVHTDGERIKVEVEDNMHSREGPLYTIITLTIGGSHVRLFGKAEMLDDFKQAVADAYEMFEAATESEAEATS